MAVTRLDPQLLRLPGGVEELVGVLQGEERVGVAVDDQQRRGRDALDRLVRRERHRVPLARLDAGALGQPRRQAPGCPLDGPVDLPHRPGAPVVPAGGAAHGHHRVRPPVQGRVAHGDRGAHREADGGQAGITDGSGVPHGRVEVEDLGVPDRGKASRPAVAAEVERHDAAEAAQHVRDAPRRPLTPGAGEPVGDDDAEIGVASRGGVRRVDPHTVLRDQRRGECCGERHGTSLFGAASAQIDEVRHEAAAAGASALAAIGVTHPVTKAPSTSAHTTSRQRCPMCRLHGNWPNGSAARRAEAASRVSPSSTMLACLPGHGGVSPKCAFLDHLWQGP